MTANMTITTRTDAAEVREGGVRWLCAISEAEAIGREMLSRGRRSTWSKRVDRLAARIERLNWLKDDIDAPVCIHPIRGASLFVPLCEAPHALRSLMVAISD